MRIERIVEDKGKIVLITVGMLRIGSKRSVKSLEKLGIKEKFKSLKINKNID